MSQQLPRVTRISQRAPSSPSTAHPAGRNLPPGAEVCPRCGAWVGDQPKHDEFHDAIAALVQWARIQEDRHSQQQTEED